LIFLNLNSLQMVEEGGALAHFGLGAFRPLLEIKLMRIGQRPGLVAAILAPTLLAVVAACAAPAAAQGSHHRAHHARHVAYRHSGAGVGYLPLGASGRGEGYQELVGDPDGGVGFYPLPTRYRIGAYRYHMRDAGLPPYLRNGVLYAMMADRARYGYWNATPINSYKYGVYDPFEGVGTPYFAGYYGSAGDSDEPSFPFGNSYAPR
jgi:hypothetical protein